MKYIKNRSAFLNEAKIKDVIFKRQADQVRRQWGEKYLEYEEVEPTDKIKQGKWKLEEDDKIKVLGAFFEADMGEVFRLFSEIPDKFADLISKSVDISLISGENDKKKYASVLKNFNIKKPTIDQMVDMFNNIFRKLSTGETMATEMVSKGEDGRPLRDEKNNIVKISKEAGAPIFSKNLVNINSFVEDYNKCYPDDFVPTHIFDDYNIRHIRDLASNDCNGSYKVDFAIFDKDVYLSISHNPKDILNMSISKFYDSCQNLYQGGYVEQLLSNVFDPNSIPAFLVFDTPITWEGEKISDQLPLSRTMIRNLESFDETEIKEPRIFFDRAYPDRMKKVFKVIIEKYSGNIESNIDRNSEKYLYSPDVDISDDTSKMKQPYMDILALKKGSFIGINTKTLYLSRIDDWSKYKISKNAKIKELIIETTELPENLLQLNLKLDWIKFKLLKIATITNFDKLKTNAIAFDKCSFDGSVLKTLKEFNPGLDRLQLIACDVTNLDLSAMGDLEELQLVYTLESNTKLKDIMSGVTVKKLVISGDLVSKENKAYLNSLKSKGIRIETVGPVI